MEDLEKRALELFRIKEWKVEEYKNYSIHPRSYENYLRLQEQLKHLTQLLNFTLDIEFIRIEDSYFQMLTLASEHDINYLIRINEEEFMTYLDGNVYVLTIPDPLMMDTCHITYTGNDDMRIQLTSNKDAKEEKIVIQLDTIEMRRTILIFPWDKKYKRFVAGMTEADSMKELYVRDDEEVTLKYHMKEQDHRVDFSLIPGYIENTNQLYSVSYQYSDSNFPLDHRAEQYVLNVKKKRNMLMNDLKKDSYLLDFMDQVKSELAFADPKLYKRIQHKFPIIETFFLDREEEKEKSLRYIN